MAKREQDKVDYLAYKAEESGRLHPPAEDEIYWATPLNRIMREIKLNGLPAQYECAKVWIGPVAKGLHRGRMFISEDDERRARDVLSYLQHWNGCSEIPHGHMPEQRTTNNAGHVDRLLEMMVSQFLPPWNANKSDLEDRDSWTDSLPLQELYPPEIVIRAAKTPVHPLVPQISLPFCFADTAIFGFSFQDCSHRISQFDNIHGTAWYQPPLEAA